MRVRFDFAISIRKRLYNEGKEAKGSPMKTIHLQAVIGEDGLLRIETPTEYKNIAAEVVVVLNPVSPEAMRTPAGYPVDFFERLDAIEADDLIERPPQGNAEIREPLD